MDVRLWDIILADHVGKWEGHVSVSNYETGSEVHSAAQWFETGKKS